MKNEIEVREALMQDGTVFTVEGIDGYSGTDGYVLREFITNVSTWDNMDNSHSIRENELFGRGMNVNKFGPTCVTLYSYDMLGKKIIGKMNYNNVNIITTKAESSEEVETPETV